MHTCRLCPLGYSIHGHFCVCARVMQADFKSSLANTLGGGGAIPADEIIIDSITAGSVTVAWHVEIPPEIMTDVASLVTTLAEDSASISVSVGGETIVASAIAHRSFMLSQMLIASEPSLNATRRVPSILTSRRQHLDRGRIVTTITMRSRRVLPARMPAPTICSSQIRRPAARLQRAARWLLELSRQWCCCTFKGNPKSAQC